MKTPREPVVRRFSFTVTEASGDSFDAAGKVELTYDPAEPMTVEALFLDPTGGDLHVPWTISRDVLARRLAGLMDVQCWVDGVWLYLRLESQDGHATFRLVAANVDAFLASTRRLVPYGKERIDIDAELAALLGGAR